MSKSIQKPSMNGQMNSKIMSTGPLWGILLLAALLLISLDHHSVEGKHHHSWERPGCHKVGHTRRIQIPECLEFSITTNACRGFCESFSVPSGWHRLVTNPSQHITSVGQCCNILDTEDVMVNAMCIEGPRQLLFKSANSCSCYHCKKE